MCDINKFDTSKHQILVKYAKIFRRKYFCNLPSNASKISEMNSYKEGQRDGYICVLKNIVKNVNGGHCVGNYTGAQCQIQFHY